MNVTFNANQQSYLSQISKQNNQKTQVGFGAGTKVVQDAVKGYKEIPLSPKQTLQKLKNILKNLKNETYTRTKDFYGWVDIFAPKKQNNVSRNISIAGDLVEKSLSVPGKTVTYRIRPETALEKEFVIDIQKQVTKIKNSQHHSVIPR